MRLSPEVELGWASNGKEMEARELPAAYNREEMKAGLLWAERMEVRELSTDGEKVEAASRGRWSRGHGAEAEMEVSGFPQLPTDGGGDGGEDFRQEERRQRQLLAGGEEAEVSSSGWREGGGGFPRMVESRPGAEAETETGGFPLLSTDGGGDGGKDFRQSERRWRWLPAGRKEAKVASRRWREGGGSFPRAVESRLWAEAEAEADGFPQLPMDGGGDGSKDFRWVDRRRR